MANDQKTIGEIYAERATQESPEIARRQETVPSAQDFRSSGPVIYGGSPPSSQDEFAKQALEAKNKAVTPRKRSPFNVMVTMVLIAVAIVLYVGNVIAVQQLLKDVNDRQERLQQILNEQEVLKAQINRMSSLERIRTMAEGTLGLRNPNGPPEWIEVDSSKIRELDEGLSSQEPGQMKSEQ